MNKIFKPCIATSILTLLLSGCSPFKTLEQDLDDLSEKRFQAFGTVDDKTDSGKVLVVVYLGSSDGSTVLDYTPLINSGEFETWLISGDGWYFAFVDANGDSMFQNGESYGWSNGGKPVRAEMLADQPIHIDIEVAGSGQLPPPAGLVDRPVAEEAALNLTRSGEIASPDEERFSEEAAGRGLWEPYGFLMEGNTGIYFVEPYDPDKVPVLFVHGIGGYPAQFNDLIASLDTQRYQAWFLNYPSGFRLQTLGNGVFYMLERLRIRLGFEQMHLVAHSMGGLVSRWYLRACFEQEACDYLRTFTSIASPFNGVESAAYGVEYAPVAIPSWRDLNPGSRFLSELFDQPLPGSVEHYLLFSYRLELSMSSIISIESSDGVIPLNSQLRPEAQKQATRLTGFDQTHVGILGDPEAARTINQIIAAANDP